MAAAPQRARGHGTKLKSERGANAPLVSAGRPARASAWWEEGPRAAASCERACGPGAPPRPSLSRAFRKASRMTAQLHLSENALALHLLLQRFEGLIDIVVADENLHERSYVRGLLKAC